MVQSSGVKLLCVCEGGTVRSVSLAWVLKYEHGQDAIAASWLKNSQETLDLLAKWADRIVVLQPKFSSKFESFKAKLVVFDVGPDIWVNPLHPKLLEIVRRFALDWSSKNFKI